VGIWDRVSRGVDALARLLQHRPPSTPPASRQQLRADVVDELLHLSKVAAGPGSRDPCLGQCDGIVLVTPARELPDPLPPALAEELERLVTDRSVIVDLSGVTLVSAAPVVGLAGWVVGASRQPDQCCVVCSRPTARALLRSWGITRCLVVFGSIGDALQARRFAHDGYGSGWSPAAFD
jgi:anti-anti-sigma regulatory factor